MLYRRLLLVSAYMIAGTISAYGQTFGVCDRETNAVINGIANDAQNRINSVYRMNIPPDEAQALSLLHIRARDRAISVAEVVRRDCYANYIPYQNVVSSVISVYTAGLSEFLPPSMVNVDVSEILNGRPLGGPNALIPKVRDDTLNNLGVGGDAAKIIRDPKQILPWNW